MYFHLFYFLNCIKGSDYTIKDLKFVLSLEGLIKFLRITIKNNGVAKAGAEKILKDVVSTKGMKLAQENGCS